MINRCVVLGTIALLVSAAMTTAQRPNFSAPSGSCVYYINKSGHAVPRPCGDWHHQAPPSDATARCGDGTYSYSEHPSAPGICSHHAGVTSYCGDLDHALRGVALAPGRRSYLRLSPATGIKIVVPACASDDRVLWPLPHVSSTKSRSKAPPDDVHHHWFGSRMFHLTRLRIAVRVRDASR